ncbi:MAG: hypothetical protein H0V44_18815 [Planctomycetes bacterium]|nr:hypothetical protein [Planctomycetota bacterium]
MSTPTNASIHDLTNGRLTVGGRSLLSDVPTQVSAVADPLGVGIYLRVTSDKSAARHVIALGKPVGASRFSACYRNEPYWMRATAVDAAAAVPVETQFLLAQLENGYAIVVPLIDRRLRASLEGATDGTLCVVAESDDPGICSASMVAAFVAVGDDPYALVRAGARSVAAFLSCGRLRRDKPLPPFVDLFGWCTWDAFYHDVTHAKVQEGLASFTAGGVTPKLLILDDGWQSIRQMPTGEKRLTAFAANEKFPGGLAPTVAMAKNEFGIETFLVWHAFQGYWGGVDGEALPRYRVVDTVRDFSPGNRHHTARVNEYFGKYQGTVVPDDIHRFYNDYHRSLREQGVDGVKVDNQSSQEGLSRGLGGRVEVMRRYHEALEGSVNTHFAGNLINCMSCSNDMMYQTLASTVTRTSVDFWPNDPASHGLHLYVNAQNSLWFGEFVHPDWDMFQSAHAMGAFHAAGRAVSGCAVYVSDKPDAHDAALLKKMVLADGRVPRALDLGLPTRDCLFADPTREPVLLKVFNRNVSGGVVAAFNCNHHPEEKDRRSISGQVRPSDVEGLAGDAFALFAQTTQTVTTAPHNAGVSLDLAELAFEIVTVAPIVGGVAIIGLADRFNSGGAVASMDPDPRGGVRVELRDGGRFLAWCERKPSVVEVDSRPAAFAYRSADRTVHLDLPNGPHHVRIVAG